jgi:hypothetical protein
MHHLVQALFFNRLEGEEDPLRHDRRFVEPYSSYRSLNWGLRFSIKARKPSRPSSEV